MIYPYTNETNTQWGHGKFQVQLVRAGYTKPMGYCDGTEDDERELRAMGEEEGVLELKIERKTLKTGREIWTLGEVPTADVDPFE